MHDETILTSTADETSSYFLYYSMVGNFCSDSRNVYHSFFRRIIAVLINLEFHKKQKNCPILVSKNALLKESFK